MIYSEFPAASYDEWKLRSPYDDGPFEEEECQHEDYEINWEGRAECQRCDYKWWPSSLTLKAHEQAQRAYERRIWWQNTRIMLAWRWLREKFRRPPPPLDDEIPF